MTNVGKVGYYSNSTIDGIRRKYLAYGDGSANVVRNGSRSQAYGMRCIMDWFRSAMG